MTVFYLVLHWVRGALAVMIEAPSLRLSDGNSDGSELGADVRG
jgi:hypothetical protein